MGQFFSSSRLKVFWLLLLVLLLTTLVQPNNSLQAAASLKVQYRTADTSSPGDNQIKPHFNIVNTGTTSVVMSELKLRYYFTKDGSGSMVYNCDWAVKGCGNISGTFAAATGTNTDIYLELSFTAGAGSIAAGQSSGEMQIRLNKSDWTNFNESNDYSFDPTKTAFADWNKVVLIQNGVVMWGTPPSATNTNTPTRASTANDVVTPSRTSTRPITPSRTSTRAITRTSTPTRTRTRTNTHVVPPTNTPVSTSIGDPHLTNPFLGATWYRNPDYAASVNAAADLQGGTLGVEMRKVANIPTFIWLDSIDAVNGGVGYTRSLEGHLDAAVAQGANTIGIVLYNLPNRNCAALAFHGELLIAENGFNRYKTEYIDRIAQVISSKPAYSNLRIITVVEPTSLNLMASNFHLQYPLCLEASNPGGYKDGIIYALNRLKANPSIYAYMDIGNHSVAGWDSVLGPYTTLVANTIKATVYGANSIDGFISNTAHYSVTSEPFMTADQLISGQPVRFASFFEWSNYIDEATYGAAWKNAMIAQGIPPGNVDMLIDTSRNGWGGPQRPVSITNSTDLNTFVNLNRIDRRLWLANWCNQDGAGLGAVPQANPPVANGLYQAFVWVKPPGVSDGSSVAVPAGPENPRGYAFDRDCDPLYDRVMGSIRLTGALPNAPVFGRWFQSQFAQLVTNAYPPLP